MSTKSLRTICSFQLLTFCCLPKYLFPHPNFYAAAQGLPSQLSPAEGISDFHLLSVVERSDASNDILIHTYIIYTSFFRCSPLGFSAACLQQMQGSVVEGLSQTATSGSQGFFV